MPLNTKRLNSTPNVLVLRKGVENLSDASKIDLLIHGQTLFLFDCKSASTFTIYNKDQSDGLQVSLTETEFLVTRISNQDQYHSMGTGKSGGLSSKSGAYYWFSLDSQNQVFYAGVGEARIETITYEYHFDPKEKLWEENKAFLESLVMIEFAKEIHPIRILKNPVTTKVSLKVKGTDALTMDDVATNTYLPYSALPSAGKTLYDCVAGENFTLDTPEFPDFAEAINYSINTPGLWCNTRLKEKAMEFGKDPQPLETYLRITLGQNNGESPGIPYVMEIWPVGHYSPVHNHGGANAIIRVLSGDIHVKLYPYLCDDLDLPSESAVEPFATADFTKGDITWISQTLNQVHQLKNLESNKSACITIQCYMYDEMDKSHYDYFDYLGDHNAKKQYEPDSDMDFVDFKKMILAEWMNRNVLSNQSTQKIVCAPFGCQQS